MVVVVCEEHWSSWIYPSSSGHMKRGIEFAVVVEDNLRLCSHSLPIMLRHGQGNTIPQ